MGLCQSLRAIFGSEFGNPRSHWNTLAENHNKNKKTAADFSPAKRSRSATTTTVTTEQETSTDGRWLPTTWWRPTRRLPSQHVPPVSADTQSWYIYQTSKHNRKCHHAVRSNCFKLFQNVPFKKYHDNLMWSCSYPTFANCLDTNVLHVWWLTTKR